MLRNAVTRWGLRASAYGRRSLFDTLLLRAVIRTWDLKLVHTAVPLRWGVQARSTDYLDIFLGTRYIPTRIIILDGMN